MSRSSANIILLIAAAIWGGGFVVLFKAMEVIGPWWFTSINFTIAFLAVLPLAVYERRQVGYRISLNDLKLLFPLAIVFSSAAIVQQFAVQSTSVINVGFLTSSYVVIVPCIEIVVFGQSLKRIQCLAAILALLGIGLLSGGLHGFRSGDLLSLLSAFCFASQMVIMKQFVNRSGRPIAAATFQSLSCAVIGSVIAVASGPLKLSMLWLATPELAYSGVLSAGVAFALVAICQKYTQPTDTAVILTSESLFGAVFAMAILGERLTTMRYIGGACVLLSLLSVQFGEELIVYFRSTTVGRKSKHNTRPDTTSI